MSEELNLEDLEALAECVEYYRMFGVNFEGYKDFKKLAGKLDKVIQVEVLRRRALEVMFEGPMTTSFT